MPCPEKEELRKPLRYMWSPAQMCYLQDNLKSDHQCYKPLKKKHFMQINKEVIAD